MEPIETLSRIPSVTAKTVFVFVFHFGFVGCFFLMQNNSEGDEREFSYKSKA